MGYMRHHLIAISSHSEGLLIPVRDKALEIFKDTWDTNFSKMVGDIVSSPINGESTFIIYPDGSKEGWEASDIGDNYRTELVSYINSQRYDDGSNSINYVEVYYRDDNEGSEVVNHN